MSVERRNACEGIMRVIGKNRIENRLIWGFIRVRDGAGLKIGSNKVNKGFDSFSVRNCHILALSFIKLYKLQKRFCHQLILFHVQNVISFIEFVDWVRS